MRPIGVWTAVPTVLVFCAYLALGLSAYRAAIATEICRAALEVRGEIDQTSAAFIANNC